MNNKLKMGISSIAIVTCLGAMVGFSSGSKENHNQKIKTTHVSNEKIIGHTSGLLAAETVDSMLVKSNLLVCGEVVGKSKPFKIKSVEGGEGIYTDYYFKPTTTLMGKCTDTKLSIRVEGGEVDGVLSVHEQEPKLKEGHKYMLFLVKPNVGGGFNTEGNYYYVCGAAQGTLEQVGNETYQSQLANIGIVKLSNIKVKAQKLNGSYSLRENEQRNLKSNLDEGVISQKEYDQSIKEQDIYAKIIK